MTLRPAEAIYNKPSAKNSRPLVYAGFTQCGPSVQIAEPRLHPSGRFSTSTPRFVDKHASELDAHYRERLTEYCDMPDRRAEGRRCACNSLRTANGLRYSI